MPDRLSCPTPHWFRQCRVMGKHEVSGRACLDSRCGNSNIGPALSSTSWHRMLTNPCASCSGLPLQIVQRPLLFAALLLAAAVAPASAVTTSSLWGIAGEKWDPAGLLPDFSFAGWPDHGSFPVPGLPGASSAAAAPISANVTCVEHSTAGGSCRPLRPHHCFTFDQQLG